MADIKISELPAATAPLRTSLLAGVTASVTEKVTVAQLITAALVFGTISASDPLVFSQTWSNAGVTFVGKSNDITNTNSNAASLVERWRVGGANVFSIQRDGSVTAAGNLVVSGTGPHAIGGATVAYNQVRVTGAFEPSIDGGSGLTYDGSLTCGQNFGIVGFLNNPTLIEASTGTHGLLYGADFRLAITDAGASATTTATVNVTQHTSNAGTVNAASLRIAGAPTGATNNYALWVAGGSVRVDGTGPHSIGGGVHTDRSLLITGTFAPVGNAFGIYLDQTYTVPASGAASAVIILPTMTKAGSGTHADFTSLRVDAPVINGSGSTVTNASTVKITGAPTGATNNYALWVDAGDSRFDGNITSGTTSALALATVNGVGFKVENTVATLVNYIGVNGAATGVRSKLFASGSDTDVGLEVFTKGAGNIYFATATNAATQVAINHTASAVNYLVLTGSAAGGDCLLYPTGTSTDIGLQLGTWGAGAARFMTGNLSVEQVRITHTASATRHITLTGSNGGNPKISTSAGSLDLSAVIVEISTGRMDFVEAGAGSLGISLGNYAGRSSVNATNSLNLFNGTAPVGTMTNGVTIYSSGGECFIMDAGGTATQQTSHDEDGNYILHTVYTTKGKRVKIDVEKMLRVLNEKFGWDFIHEYALEAKLN